jgi:hypothetical protein
MLSSLKGKVAPTKGNLALGALAGLAGTRMLLKKEPDTTQIDQLVNNAVAKSKSEKVARLLEQSRMEKALAENQMRLARQAPDLYTSVMAGRRVPKGSVVLGGRPRQDLMKELAASMDSGRYAQPDPLSDLMG